MELFDGFEDWEDVKRQFEMSEDSPDEVLLAWYGGGSYEGDAIVIYRRDQSFFVSEGSHCSCYGLECQWDPDEYESKDVLLAYLNGRHEYDHDKASAIGRVISYLQGEP